MSTRFDEYIKRTGTGSLKYDFAVQRGKPADILPLWVADMDFQTVPEVIEALVRAAEHGIFGYTESTAEYTTAVLTWYATRFQWQIDPAWLIKTPGVVYAIATAIRALTEKGDAIIIQEPVYYPFFGKIEANHRTLVTNPLVYKDGTYHIDFDDFESKVKQYNVKMFIMSSPHNPVGRVWTREELIRLGDICVQHNVIVISDEIHSDFVYDGFKHHVFAALKPEFLERAITCTAPSKTFNLAGLQTSNIFIANPHLRQRFQTEMTKSGYSQLNTMGLVACQAAYTYGAPWLDSLIQYLTQNIQFTKNFLANRLPKIRMVEPQGTYLLWLDCRALNLTETERNHLIAQKAKLWLSTGTTFGQSGTGFERMNIACPRSTLETALCQLEHALHE